MCVLFSPCLLRSGSFFVAAPGCTVVCGASIPVASCVVRRFRTFLHVARHHFWHVAGAFTTTTSAVLDGPLSEAEVLLDSAVDVVQEFFDDEAGSGLNWLRVGT